MTQGFQEPAGGKLFEILEGAREPFLVQGVISSSVTMLYGVPKCGKSALIVNLVASALSDESFLGVNFEQPVAKVIILATDSGGKEEYAARLVEAGVSEDEDRIRVWQLPSLTADYIDSLRAWDQFSLAPGDLVIVDGVSSFEGDGNSMGEVAALTAALERLRGDNPLVLVAHASTSFSGSGSSKKVLGSTAWTTRARWLVRVTRRSGGVVSLDCSGNAAKSERFTLQTGAKVSDFIVTSHVSGDELEGQQTRQRQDRELKTVQGREEQARFVEEHCQGMNKNETARALHEQYPSKSESTYRQQLKDGGALGKTLARRSKEAMELAA